uniref:Uncharacterized protein n=1 Tax=Anguilla anguilla TaxID=7936 RepID=A0A0E9Q9N0_ANGAN
MKCWQKNFMFISNTFQPLENFVFLEKQKIKIKTKIKNLGSNFREMSYTMAAEILFCGKGKVYYIYDMLFA